MKTKPSWTLWGTSVVVYFDGERARYYSETRKTWYPTGHNTPEDRPSSGLEVALLHPNVPEPPISPVEG